jgi:hypothetical protein
MRKGLGFTETEKLSPLVMLMRDGESRVPEFSAELILWLRTCVVLHRLLQPDA